MLIQKIKGLTGFICMAAGLIFAGILAAYWLPKSLADLPPAFWAAEAVFLIFIGYLLRK